MTLLVLKLYFFFVFELLMSHNIQKITFQSSAFRRVIGNKLDLISTLSGQIKFQALFLIIEKNSGKREYLDNTYLQIMTTTFDENRFIVMF